LEVCCRIVLFAFALCEFGKKHGFFEGLIAGGFKLGAQGAEFGNVALSGPVDALLIKREELEIVALGEPTASLLRASSMSIRGASSLAEGAERALLACSEDGGIRGTATIGVEASAMPCLAAMLIQRSVGR
jgi:hypothetical protein